MHQKGKKKCIRQERIGWNPVRNKGKLSVCIVAPACLAMTLCTEILHY